MSRRDKILGPISLIDCFVFLIFLAPQLLLQAGPLQTLSTITQTLPFLFCLPIHLLHERYLLPRSDQSPFVRHASLFQDLVIRCVRYAFANIPASIGAVFFSKPVSLPFMRFRQLRHGWFTSPVHFEQVNKPGFKGVYMAEDPSFKADVLILYSHGGGFSMGSSYFYLEFLISWIVLMSEFGWNTPAVLAVEYDLVPTATFPTQLHQVKRGYEHALTLVKDGDASRICVAGDSAGATLTLSLLLSLGLDGKREGMPGFATLISPWCTLVSCKDRDTMSDYLNSESLHLYAGQYVGAIAADRTGKVTGGVAIDDPIASPGSCGDLELWKRAAPGNGFHFIYGAEEVFAPAVRDLIKVIRSIGSAVEVLEEVGGIHAWPVVSLFLKDVREDRLAGLHEIVDTMRRRMIS